MAENNEIAMRGKRRVRNEASWRRNLIKKAKDEGLRHVSLRGVAKNAKALTVEDCICECGDKFTRDQMRDVFTMFWQIGNHEKQNYYLGGCLEATGVQNFRNGGHRTIFQYKVKLHQSTIIVCRKFFLGLHGITESRLRRKVQQLNTPLTDNRGRHANHRKTSNLHLVAIRNFISNLESRESHYSRERNEQKKFLQANTTKMGLYNQFCDQYPEFSPTNDNEAGVKYSLFCKIFNFEFNIAIGFPRSDLCDACELFKTRLQTANREGNDELIQQLINDRNAHWEEAQIFYEEIRNANQHPENTLVLCADFEKNFTFPITGVNKEYFLSNVNFYNFGIQNFKNNDAHMFMYSQTFARKGSNEVATFLHYYLISVCSQNIAHVKIFMDNSTGTNKNRFVLAMLYCMCIQKFESIEIVFPKVGHSYMPIDRSFALIEKKKKHEDKVVTPEQWTDLVKKSRPSQEFSIINVEHPLTNTLRPEANTPILRVIDFKSLFTPILGRQLHLQQARRILIRRNATPLISTSLNQDCTIPLNLFLPSTSEARLAEILTDPPLAYEETLYIPVPPAAARSINVLKQYIDQPVPFFDTIA